MGQGILDLISPARFLVNIAAYWGARRIILAAFCHMLASWCLWKMNHCSAIRPHISQPGPDKQRRLSPLTTV